LNRTHIDNAPSLCPNRWARFRRGSPSDTATHEPLDERYGLTHDYTRKEDAEHSDILLSDGTHEWTADRCQLRNQVEATDKRKKAQLTWELEIGLPLELTHEKNVELVCDFVHDN
jgi:hypothetical protein